MSKTKLFLTEDQFHERVRGNPNFDPEGALIAKVGNKVVGFALAVAPMDKDHGFLSALVVDPVHQRKGIGDVLLNRAEAFLTDRGKREVRVTNRDNPVRFSICLDVSSPGYPYLLNRGYRSSVGSILMQLDCRSYEWREEVSGFVADNEARGIRFGLCGHDHRESLLELAPGLEHDLAGESPPYRVFVATEGFKVVGMGGTFWADKGGSAGGGVYTHPDYRRRKIATVLFNLMCAEFKKQGAVYSNLYTGIENPAQEIYFRIGYKVKYAMVEALTKRLE